MVDISDSICVHPLSSPYSLLPRTHTYALVLALLAPLPRGWVFKAALAAFTTRTAVFAVDAIALLAHIRKNPDDPAPLDILVATESLALASLVGAWLLLVSSRVNESSARGLIRFWTAFVGIGSIVGFVGVANLGKARPSEQDCHERLMSRSALMGEDENALVIGVLGAKIKWFAYRVGVPGVFFGAIALLSTVKPRPKRARPSSGFQDDPASNALAQAREAAWSESLLALFIKYISWVAFPALGIFIIVSAEQYLNIMAPGIPSAEPMTSVGQWGVWAATGVVLSATLINGFMVMSGMKSDDLDHAPLEHKQNGAPSSEFTPV